MSEEQGYFESCNGCGFSDDFCRCDEYETQANFPGLSAYLPYQETQMIEQYQQMIQELMVKTTTPRWIVGMDRGMDNSLVAAPVSPPAATAVPRCSGCDQERDLGATGRCWDCYVVVEKRTTARQMQYDAAEAVKAEQIKRTTMLAGGTDPLWQRNPNVGVWRLR